MQVVELALAWNEAINARDFDRLSRLSVPQVEISGPRGAARGQPALREWLDRAGATFTVEEVFARGPMAVVLQSGTWTSDETGGTPSLAGVATLFEEEGGRLARVARFADLGEALTAAGLSRADKVPLGLSGSGG